MKYNDRFIYIMQEFNDALAHNVVKQLFELDNKSKKDIVLIINSDGGDVSALFAILGAMKIVKSSVATVCMGRAYSAAALLLIAGTKGKRFITPHSDIMFHEVSTEIEGKYSSIKDEMISLEHYDDMMQKIAKESLTIPFNRVLKRRKEAYFNADQALTIGAVDHILTDIDELTKYTQVI